MKILYVKTVEGKDTDALFFERTHSKETIKILWEEVNSSEKQINYSFHYIPD